MKNHISHYPTKHTVILRFPPFLNKKMSLQDFPAGPFAAALSNLAHVFWNLYMLLFSWACLVLLTRIVVLGLYNFCLRQHPGEGDFEYACRRYRSPAQKPDVRGFCLKIPLLHLASVLQMSLDPLAPALGDEKWVEWLLVRSICFAVLLVLPLVLCFAWERFQREFNVFEAQAQMWLALHDVPKAPVVEERSVPGDWFEAFEEKEMEEENKKTI